MTSEPSLNCRHLSIWQERHDASSLLIEDEAEFIRFMLAEIPPAPAEAAAIRTANSGVAAAAA